MPNVINKGMILNISSNADVYARGEKYYRDGKLLSLKSENQNGITIVKGTIEGNYRNYEVMLRLEPDGALQKYTCSCESHSIWRGACKHVVAVLFSLIEGKTNVLAASAAEQTARTLTDALEKLIFEDIDAGLTAAIPVSATPVRLVPCFHYETRGETYLTFSIGYGRMYIIKSFPAFINSMKHEETVSYGKNLTFKHMLSVFDDESRRLLAFLIREEGLYAEALKKMGRQYQYMYAASQPNARALTLSERSFDDFYDLYAGCEIEAEIDGKTTLAFVEGMPDFKLHVVSETDQTNLTADTFNFRVKHGVRYHYIISQSAIHRVEKNDALLLIQILKALVASPRSEITFTRTLQKRFLSVVLPRLSKLGLIGSVEGDVRVEQVNDLQIKLYFDTDGHGVTVNVMFCYGEASVNALEDAPQDMLRDTAGEYTVKRRLAMLGFNPDTVSRLYTLSGNEAVYAFLNEPSGLESLRDCAEVFVTDALEKKTVKVKTPSIGLRLQGSLLDVTLDDAGYSLTELLEALDAYRARKKFHRLKDGRFLPLDGEGIAAVAELVDALDVSRKDVHGDKLSLPSYRALYVDRLTKNKEAVRTVNHDKQFTELIERFDRDAVPFFEIPESLSGILRAYQKTGYQWLKTLAHYGFGGILADDMGLGKTLQVIAVLLCDQKPGARSLVVAPTSLLYNWEREIKRFAPSLTTTVVSGLPDKRRELLTGITTDVYITTYDTMKRDIAHYEKIYFDYIIADEAQNIKNASTQNAKAIKELKGRIRFALTGTPIENALTELWSIFDFIMPGYLYSAHKFNRLYEYPIIKDNDQQRAARLREQIAPFVLRRVKKNVLTELPDKTETTLLAEMDDEQRKLYLAYLMQAKGEFENMTAHEGFAGSRIRILAQLTRLRQICCHPALFVEQYKGGSGKLDLTLETIQMTVESGHRILLFSQFTSMLDILRKALDESPYGYFFLDGAVKSKERMEMTERFNAGERELFLISLKAGGTGLNLTGADVVIHYDPWWNPSVMDQASDRAHRYGQEKAVQIFNIVARDTIEEKIMALQEKKRDLIDSVITEGGSFINALTEDEVRALFM